MIKTRTNIKFIPDTKTVKNLVKFFEWNKIAFDDFITDPHCTIVYSKDIVDINTITLPKIEFPVIGTRPRFEVFDTKDDGFCLVILFDCPVAKSLYSEIKQAHSLRTIYDDYKSHVTIKKNMADRNIKLPKIPFDLFFDQIKMDNGK